jgi:hypothetical protein
LSDADYYGLYHLIPIAVVGYTHYYNHHFEDVLELREVNKFSPVHRTGKYQSQDTIPGMFYFKVHEISSSPYCLIGFISFTSSIFWP